MKNIILFILISTASISFVKAQSRVDGENRYKTYTIFCESINNIETSENVKNYVTGNYSDRISSYVAILDEHIAKITTDMFPEDLLQIYHAFGYEGIYIDNNNNKFFLNGMGRIQPVKE